MSRFAHGEYFASDPGWETAGGWSQVVNSAYRLQTYNDPQYDADRAVATAPWALTMGHLRGRVQAVTDTSRPSRPRNAALIFDYRDVQNYKLAGLRVGEQKWVMQAVQNGVASDLVTPVADATLVADHPYQLNLVVEVNRVTLYVDGQEKVRWERGGSSPRLTGGRVGVMALGGIAEFQELEVWDVTAATKTYALGGQRVALRRDGVLSYMHTDHLGSTSVLTDKNGVEVAGTRLKYYPFGAPRPDGASAAHNAFATGYTDATFTGQRRDVGTGLYFYGARYYNSAIGRFLAPDTIVPQPGNPQALNRYAYAANNPLRYTDPSGHDIKSFLSTFSEVMGGFGAQMIYVNSLQTITALAAQPNESEAATFGRHMANVVALVQGVEEMVSGAGLMGGGAVACGTGVLCLAGAPAMVAGAAVATHGVGVAGIAAAQEGQMLSNLVMQARGQPTEKMGDVQKHGRPESNVVQNKQFRGAVQSVEKELGRKLSRDEIRELHEAAHELGNPGYDDIINLAHDLFGGK